MKHYSRVKYIIKVILEAIILFTSVQLSLLVGFLLGRSRSNQALNQNTAGNQSEKSLFSHQTKQTAQRKSVKIDSSTFVTKADEEQLTGTGRELGNQTIIVDDVSASAFKLAQLKRNK